MYRRTHLFRCLPSFAPEKALGIIMEKFSEARELLQDARESHGTSYFAADLEDAQSLVQEVNNDWTGLLCEMERRGLAAEKGALERANGLKIQQLNEEYDILTHDDE